MGSCLGHVMCNVWSDSRRLKIAGNRRFDMCLIQYDHDLIAQAQDVRMPHTLSTD